MQQATLVKLIVFSLSAGLLHAQSEKSTAVPLKTGMQQGTTDSSSTTGQSSGTSQPLLTVGQAISQGFLDAPTTKLNIDLPPEPSVEAQLSSFLRSLTTDVTASAFTKGNELVQAGQNFWSGTKEDPLGTTLTVGGTALGLFGAFHFDPEDITMTNEILGEGKMTNLGVGPGLVAGGISDPLASFWGPISDAAGGIAVDFAAAAGNGSKIGPVIYNGLQVLKSANDIAEKNAKESEPQTFPVEPVMTLPGGDISIAQTLQAARQRQAGLAAAEQAAGQDNANLDSQIVRAQAQAQMISDQLARGLSVTVPSDWVPCQCPADHPGAGIFVDGVQYHTPLLHCPQ